MFKSPIIASLPPVPNYSKLFSLDIQTGSCAINADSTSGYFSIKKIEFVKKPRVQSIIWIKIGYLFISLLIILLFFRSHSFNGEKTKSLSKIIKVSNQKPTATSNSDSLIFRNLCEKSFEIQKENTPDTQNIPIPSIRSKSEEGLERVEKYFHENYGNSGLTAELIAKSVEIPQERVTTLLKQKYKMTIPQYLNFIRIEAAKKLLIKSAESSIKEIAAKVGYSQVSHFNHKFNEIVGTSPQEFRKNYEV
jgi:AraC-like DNA-binding protein